MHLLLMLALLSAIDVDYHKVFAPEDEAAAPARIVPKPIDLPPAPPVKPPAPPVKPKPNRPLSLEINKPAGSAAPSEKPARPQVAIDAYKQSYCDPCHKDEAQNGTGDERILLTWKNALPPRGVLQVLPAYVWRDSMGFTRYANGRHTLDQLYKKIERNPPWKLPPRVMSPSASVRFGEPWYENSTGRTSIQHLMREHGLSYGQIAPYLHDQNALDRIHGWRHTGRGTLPPGTVASRREDHLPVPAATGVAGTFHGSEHIDTALNWWDERIGQDIPTSIEWDRTGAQTTSLLSIHKITILQLIGRLGAVRVSAPGSKLPVDEAELAYRKLANGKWRINGSADLEFSEDLSPSPSGSSIDTPVQFADPATILTLISVARTIWGLFHPKADITLGGNVAMTAMLHGDTLGIDFRETVKLKIDWIIDFELGVRRIEVSRKLVKIYFDGKWIKSREFAVD